MSAAVETVKPSDNGSAELVVKVNTRFAELLANAPVEQEGEGKARLLDRLLNADNIEAAAGIFAGMDSSEDVVGIPLMVTGFIIRESDFEGGVGAYATVFATNRDTSEDVNFNTGAETILALLLVAHSRGWLPLAAHVEGKHVRSGNTAYNLILDK